MIGEKSSPKAALPKSPLVGKIVDLLLKGVSTAKDLEALESLLMKYDPELEWRHIDDKVHNEGPIRINTDPVKVLAEVISNGFDAIIERALDEEQGPVNVSSPAEAAKLIGMGKNVLQSSNDLSGWFKKNMLKVTYLDSGIKASPTISVMDSGTGVHFDDFDVFPFVFVPPPPSSTSKVSAVFLATGLITNP